MDDEDDVNLSDDEDDDVNLSDDGDDVNPNLYSNPSTLLLTFLTLLTLLTLLIFNP